MSFRSFTETELSNISTKHKSPFPKFQSVERELFECNGECGNAIATFIECCVKDEVKELNRCLIVNL